MADLLASVMSFKKKFYEEITCSVCHELYTDPRILSCFHFFCLECIESLPKETEGGKYYLRCPQCRQRSLLPQGYAMYLPKAFSANSLLELRTELDAIIADNHPLLCPLHNDPYKVYCETCCQVICRDCTISRHNAHYYSLISECYPRYFQQIQSNLSHIKHKISDIEMAMAHLNSRKKEVQQQGQLLKEDVHKRVQEMPEVEPHLQIRLSQQIDSLVHQKVQLLRAQEVQSRKLFTDLKTCAISVEHSLKTFSKVQLLSSMHKIMAEMHSVSDHVDVAVFQPIENVDMKLEETETGLIITGTTFGKVILESLPRSLNKPSKVTLTLLSQDGSPFSLPPSVISCTLHKHFPSGSVTDSSIVKCVQTGPGRYVVALGDTSLTRKDQLVVQVGGVIVQESPFDLFPGPSVQRSYCVDGLKNEVFEWQEMSITIHVPAGVVAPGDTCNITVAPIIPTDCVFPKNSVLVSGVFEITTSCDILKPITVQMQHSVCFSTLHEIRKMVFAKASLPLYQFTECEGGKFAIGSQYGIFECKTFSWIGIFFRQLLFGRIGCSVQMLHSTDKPEAHLVFTQDNRSLMKLARDDSIFRGCEERGYVAFFFSDGNQITVRAIEEESQHALWTVKPIHRHCRIAKRTVIYYNGSQSTPVLSFSLHRKLEHLTHQAHQDNSNITFKFEGATDPELSLSLILNCSYPEKIVGMGIEPLHQLHTRTTITALPPPVPANIHHSGSQEQQQSQVDPLQPLSTSCTPSSTLTVDQLLIELKDLVEWELFGIHLPEINDRDIQIISKKCSNDVNLCKLNLFSEWLRKCPSASWENVRLALKTSGEHRLAESIYKRHMHNN